MFTSIVGYPRIGALRELKFATEKYFRNEININQLEETAKEIRKNQWQIQKDSGIDFIPSNDFSFYDSLLDTAILFNIIPARYRKLQLSEIDTYFAMARGYQGGAGDVKALAMKKWFNTNYHYLVPEIEDNTDIKLTGTKLFDDFIEAKSIGIQTKPVVIGAFTLLKLARFTGTKCIKNFADSIISAYSHLLDKSEKNGV
jgi:5-methyltetrahydropteroyltriglutamate--homocysteine methyltransferase